jgi:hypothetical protein
MRALVVGALICSTLAVACGGGSETAGSDDRVLDVRVQVPATDPTYVDFVSPEFEIEPGVERMDCVHFRYDGEDTAIQDVNSLQGKYGHHAVLLAAKDPKEPGTREDCTNAEDMTKYDPFAIPVELPEGLGVYLPKGKPLVLQIHYVNAGKKPIRVRDVVRLKTIPIASVRRWAATFATNSLDVKVPARGESTLSFDCAVPIDADLLLLGGHMHEHGKRIAIELGPDDKSLEQLYATDWTAEYRDAPPITMMMTNPKPLQKGHILRTTCTWSNTESRPLTFPEEMCSAFGYVAGSKDAVVCRHGEGK